MTTLRQTITQPEKGFFIDRALLLVSDLALQVTPTLGWVPSPVLSYACVYAHTYIYI